MVTIAIPIYNAEKYLRLAIQSCINQTYKDWILLLMCDGSTDNSTTIAYEMAKNDKRIKIINDNENKGLIARLNQSIEITQSKYYARMDADDIMYITRIEEQVKYMEEHPDVDVVGASIMTIDDNNRIVGSGLSKGKVIGFIHPTVMGKAEWFKNNPYASWPIRAEDTELWLRTYKHSSFYAIGKPLLYYREFGVPTFHKYYLSQKTLLKIFSKPKHYNMSLSCSIRNIAFSILKISVYAIYSLFGKTDVIIKNRRRNLIHKKYWLSDKDLEKCIQSAYNK